MSDQSRNPSVSEMLILPPGCFVRHRQGGGIGVVEEAGSGLVRVLWLGAAIWRQMLPPRALRRAIP